MAHSIVSRQSRIDKSVVPKGYRACTLCGVVKPFTEFYRSKGTRLGVLPRCKACSYTRKSKRKPFKQAVERKQVMREYEQGWRQERIKKGMCIRCGKNEVEMKLVLGRWQGKRKCSDCLARARAEDWNKAQKVRRRLLAIYGRVCVCCGESDARFLTLDHVYNDGAEDRKRYHGGCEKNLERFAKRRRNDLQTLCYNCNCGKERCRGVCPHKIVAEGETWNAVAV